MEIAGAVLAVIVVGVFIGLFISAAFLLWGARIAGVENRSFGKALGTTLLGGIASFILSLVLSVLPVIGTVVSFIGGFLIAALIMMAIFKTTYGKALWATILTWVLSLVVVGGLILLGIAAVGGWAVLGQKAQQFATRQKQGDDLSSPQLPNLSRVREKVCSANCISNQTAIWKAATLWGLNPRHSSRPSFPPDFQTLVKDGGVSPEMFICPSSGRKPGPMSQVDQWSDYIMVPNRNADDGQAVLIYEKSDCHNGEGGNVILVCGKTIWCNADEYRRRTGGLGY